MIQKQTGYYKNVYLTQGDYLPFKNWKDKKKRRKFWLLVSFSVLLLIGVVWLIRFF